MHHGQWQHGRMEKAKETLNATNKGLAEISQSVGYQSEAAFSKAFRRVVGISPGVFRHGKSTVYL